MARKGMRPKEGEKAIKVKNLRLFHVSQVRPLTNTDKDLIAKQIEKGVPVQMPDATHRRARARPRPRLFRSPKLPRQANAHQRPFLSHCGPFCGLPIPQHWRTHS